MRVLRSLVSVAAGVGFLMSAGLVGGSLSTTVARVSVTAVGAIIAGWIAARLAAFAPFGHAAALAAIVATVTVSLIVSGPAGSGFTAAAGVIAVAGTLVGGAIRAAAGHPREGVNTARPS